MSARKLIRDEDDWEDPEPEIVESSPYCECNLERTIEEADWGICAHCGRPILE